MQTLEVTDEQYAYIQHLREQISEQVVGKYGTVRERDAVQFLIDNLDDELDVDVEFDPESPSDARAMSYQEDDGGGTGEPTDTEEDRSAEDEETDSAEDADAEDEDAEVEDVEEADAEDAETGSADEEGTSDGESSGGEASDDDMLDRMMNLLDTHDDKWDESPAADYRYRVDLPEGGTEDVQTKDDVRALLFKHY